MLLLPLLFVCVAALMRADSHAWGDDWSQYVNHARNLAEGRPFADTGYLFNPDRPNIGPPSYPPGTAFLLAPVVAAVGVDVPALKLVSIVCLGLSFAVLLYLGSRLVGPLPALVATILFALHPEVTKWVRIIGSEPPFFLSTLMALYLAGCWRRAGPSLQVVGAILTGLMICAAVSCRSIGIALLPAIFLHETLNRRLFRPWVWVVLVTSLAGMGLQRAYIGTADYSTEIAQWSVQKVLENLVGYWGALGFIYQMPGPIVWLMPLAMLGLFGVGLRSHLRDAVAADGAPFTARNWLPRVPLEVWYIGATLGALILLPFLANSRYVLPLFPLLLIFMVQGVWAVVGSAVRPGRTRRNVVGALVAVLAAYYAVLWWHSSVRDEATNALCDECRALYMAVQEKTRPEARIAFIKPRALALMTRRSSWAWTPDRTEQQTWDEFTAKGIDYLVTVSPRQELAELYPAFLGWDGWRSRPGTTVIYENSSFRLIRLADAETSKQ